MGQIFQRTSVKYTREKVLGLVQEFFSKDEPAIRGHYRWAKEASEIHISDTEPVTMRQFPCIVVSISSISLSKVDLRDFMTETSEGVDEDYDKVFGAQVPMTINFQCVSFSKTQLDSMIDSLMMCMLIFLKKFAREGIQIEPNTISSSGDQSYPIDKTHTARKIVVTVNFRTDCKFKVVEELPVAKEIEARPVIVGSEEDVPE